MARTSSQYFEFRKNLSANGASPTPLKVLIANSTTMKLGQLVRVNTSGLAVPAGTGNPVLGVVSGLVIGGGGSVPVNAFQFDTVRTGHTNSGDDTVVTASNNSSRAVAVYAEILVGLPDILFYNDSDNTLAQANLFQCFDVDSSSDQITVSTASDVSGQMQLVELDPDNDADVSKGLFRVAEPQLMYNHNNGDSDVQVTLNAA